MEHTSSLQRWEVASESNTNPCQGSYFRLRSLFCDLLTVVFFLLLFCCCCCFCVLKEKKKKEKKKKKTSQAENNSKTLRSCKPALKKSFPGDIKLQLQPRKPAHQATSEVENPILGDNRPTCCSFLSRHQKTPGNLCSHQQVLKGQPQGGSISLPSHFVKTISTCSSCLLRPSQKQVVERLDQYLLEKQGRSPHF